MSVSLKRRTFIAIILLLFFSQTALAWWNASWLEKSTIYLNETSGSNAANLTFRFNLTGVNVNGGRCAEEIRMTDNSSGAEAEMNVSISSNDTNRCEIGFVGNLASYENSSKYAVYWKNPNSSNPNYMLPQFNLISYLSDFEGCINARGGYGCDNTWQYHAYPSPADSRSEGGVENQTYCVSGGTGESKNYNCPDSGGFFGLGASNKAGFLFVGDVALNPNGAKFQYNTTSVLLNDNSSIEYYLGHYKCDFGNCYSFVKISFFNSTGNELYNANIWYNDPGSTKYELGANPWNFTDSFSNSAKRDFQIRNLLNTSSGYSWEQFKSLVKSIQITFQFQGGPGPGYGKANFDEAAIKSQQLATNYSLTLGSTQYSTNISIGNSLAYSGEAGLAWAYYNYYENNSAITNATCNISIWDPAAVHANNASGVFSEANQRYEYSFTPASNQLYYYGWWCEKESHAPASMQNTFTVSVKPSPPPSGGGGGGGGGGGSSEPTVITSVLFETADNLKASAKISSTKNYPETSNARVYAAAEITPSLDKSKIIRAVIKFKVERKWLEENNISIDSVVMYEYNGEMQKLDTKHIGSYENYEHYEAITTGFSTFIIAAETPAKEPENTTIPPEEPKPKEEPAALIISADYSLENNSVKITASTDQEAECYASIDNEVKKKFTGAIKYENLKPGEHAVNISCYTSTLSNSTVIAFTVKSPKPADTGVAITGFSITGGHVIMGIIAALAITAFFIISHYRQRIALPGVQLPSLNTIFKKKSTVKEEPRPLNQTPAVTIARGPVAAKPAPTTAETIKMPEKPLSLQQICRFFKNKKDVKINYTITELADELNMTPVAVRTAVRRGIRLSVLEKYESGKFKAYRLGRNGQSIAGLNDLKTFAELETALRLLQTKNN